MKKTVLMLILVIVLLLGTVPAVFAKGQSEKKAESPAQTEQPETEKKGLVGSLLSEEGALKKLWDQLKDENSPLYQAIGNLSAFVTNEDGSLNMDAVKMLLDGMLNKDGNQEQEGPVDYLGEEGKKELINYIKGLNASVIDPCDAQALYLNAPLPLLHDDGFVKVICQFKQENFKLEGKDFKLANSTEDFILVLFQSDKDGNWSIKGSLLADKGAGREASIEALCAEAGYSAEDLYGMAMWDLVKQYELTEVMKNHPEAERIEYNGTMVTGAELNDMFNTSLKAMMGN